MVLSDYAMYSRSDYNSARSVHSQRRVRRRRSSIESTLCSTVRTKRRMATTVIGSKTEDEVEQPHVSSDGWMRTFIPQERIADYMDEDQTEWGEYFLPHDTRLMIPDVLKEGPQVSRTLLGGDLHGANYVRAFAIEEVD